MASHARSRLARFGGAGALLLVAVSAAAFLWAHRLVSGSLPVLEGERALPALKAPVLVERDARGVPTIRARDRVDAARALGFLHAQERFFQMDLMRRRAAGELAELLGETVVDVDRHHRLHRMRERARRVPESASPFEREVLLAYVEGVNAGLAALDAPPFEYLLLRSEPRPWTPEDSILVVLSMFFELNDETGSHESAQGLLHDVFPVEYAGFLSPPGSEWDAPLWGDAFGAPSIPPPDRARRARPAPPGLVGEPPEVPSEVGSNNWAVGGARTVHGGAILANDMHLGHAVPNIWYRAVMKLEGDAGPPRRLVGVTLPGTAALVAGSNGSVAWGFTNTGGDWVDLVELEIDSGDPNRYLTPDGWRELEIHREAISVRGGEPVELQVRETIWGPVVDEDHRGRRRALRWIAHDPGGINLRLGLMEDARTVEDALALAPTVGIPPQNFVCADPQGSIGWTVAGRIPNRVGFDGRLPGTWARGERAWDGFLPAEEYPRVVNPPSGILWTANARVAGGEALRKLGDGGYALGARARQIRDGLLALDRAEEKDLLAIQLDDRALFLERWRTLFLELVRDRVGLEDVERALTEGWTGRASIDSVGYRAVKELRRATFEEVFTALTAEARRADPSFSIYRLRQWEGPLWKLVTERPAHLLPESYTSWEDALVRIVEKTASAWPRPLDAYTWGEANASAIRHPLSRVLPVLGSFLDMSSAPLPGDTDMPRVQGRSHGASERLVVSPGREEEALFHMPGGQSGHPLSPYYGAGHEDWERGLAAALLPGPAIYTLELRPAR